MDRLNKDVTKGVEEVKSVRLKTGLSQAQFAKTLGIPVKTLQKWEINQATPPDYVTNMITYIAENGLSAFEEWRKGGHHA